MSAHYVSNTNNYNKGIIIKMDGGHDKTLKNTDREKGWTIYNMLRQLIPQ